MDKEIGIVIGIAAVICITAGYLLVLDSKQWVEFKQANDCKVIAKESGSVIPAVGTNGSVTSVFVPGKTSWLCKDGVTYTR